MISFGKIANFQRVFKESNGTCLACGGGNRGAQRFQWKFVIRFVSGKWFELSRATIQFTNSGANYYTSLFKKI